MLHLSMSYLPKELFYVCGTLLFLTLNVLALHRHGRSYGSDMNVLHLDVNSVLNGDITLADELINLRNASFDKNLKLCEPWCVYNTDLTSAIKAMRYHRQMMKKDMLSEYLVQQIVRSVSANPPNISIGKRIGSAKNDSNEPIGEKNLLRDEGLRRDSSWLKRLTELEYKTPKVVGQNQKARSKHHNISYLNSESTVGEEDVGVGLEYIEEADITGYAYSPDENSHKFVNGHHLPIEGKRSNSFNMAALSKTGYDDGHEGYFQRIPPTQDKSQPWLHTDGAVQTNHTEEIGIKDITDIALTTLAFLSFGMFILQVLMCITMNKDDSSSMSMITMDGTNNGDVDVPVGGEPDEIRRKRRSLTSPQSHQMDIVNNLAEIALFSIDTVTSTSTNKRPCHYYSLCENNKYFKFQTDDRKVWVPIWSLAISWLTTRLDGLSIKSSSGNYEPIASLKAVIIGISGGDCFEYYNDLIKSNGCH